MKKRYLLLPLVIVVAIGVGGLIFLASIWLRGGGATPSATLEASSVDAAGLSDSAVAFQIEKQDSLVTFTLQEDLLGERNTVIGRTDEVAGEMVIDFDNPMASQLGTIVINSRTLVTDNEFRNRALRADILQSAQEQYEFIEFVPTELVGLPDSVSIGETYTFDVVGDLTMLDTTNSVTFATEVTLDSETRISGTASANVLYADWGITIPDAQGVANITDDVTLAIEFVATAEEEDDEA